MKLVKKLTLPEIRKTAMAQQGYDSALFGKRPGVTVQEGKKVKQKRGYSKHKGKIYEY